MGCQSHNQKKIRTKLPCELIMKRRKCHVDMQKKDGRKIESAIMTHWKKNIHWKLIRQMQKKKKIKNTELLCRRDAKKNEITYNTPRYFHVYIGSWMRLFRCGLNCLSLFSTEWKQMNHKCDMACCRLLDCIPCFGATETC